MMRSFTMLSIPIILIVLFAERLHTVQSFASPSIRGTRNCRQTKAAAATSRCELQLTDTPVETSSPSPRWHYVPRDVLLGQEAVADEAMHVMSGCDAVVATLDMNEGRINPNMMWARTFHDHCTNTLQNIMIEDSSTKVVDEGQINELNVPTEALEAIQATHRWSSNFVRNLQLCPWAGSSLDTIGAIRYWVLLIDEDNDGLCNNRNDDDSIYARDVHMQTILKSMEDVVRDAGEHLGQITSSRGEEYIDPIDPSVAISFIILVDKASNNANSSPDLSPAPSSLPDFGTFHEYFLDLEDRLLDECDEYWDSVEEDDEEDAEAANNKGPLGCEITIAPFHPRWKFGSDGGNDNHATVQAIDYEKRTPYPTISIVKSSAIDALMDERAAQTHTATNDNEDGPASAPVTERIADLNEKILEGLGKEKLKELFDDEVVKCPHHGGV